MNETSREAVSLDTPRTEAGRAALNGGPPTFDDLKRIILAIEAEAAQGSALEASAAPTRVISTAKGWTATTGTFPRDKHDVGGRNGHDAGTWDECRKCRSTRRDSEDPDCTNSCHDDHCINGRGHEPPHTDSVHEWGDDNACPPSTRRDSEVRADGDAYEVRTWVLGGRYCKTDCGDCALPSVPVSKEHRSEPG